MNSFTFIIVIFFFITPSTSVYTYYNTINGSNESWKSTMANLKAGDILRFGEGTYTVSSGKLGVNWPGTLQNPILIEGEAGKRVIFNRPSNVQNNLDIGYGSYFTLRNIEWVGGSRGIRVGETGNVSHAVFENLKIHDTRTTAFTCNQPYRGYTNITVRYLEVYNTGISESECFYFGCVDGACVTRDSLIEYNYCWNTTLANGGSEGSGIQVKTGSFNNIIRNNVVQDTKGAGILTYDDWDLGKNIIEGNYLINNKDNGIQTTSGSEVKNNIIINSGSNGIRVQANQLQIGKSLRNVQIYHNTIVSSSTSPCIRVDSTTSNSFIVANNAIFSTTAAGLNLGFSGGLVVANGYSGTASTGTFTIGSPSTELLNPSSQNYYPKSTSALVGSGDSSSSITNAVTLDFNCLNRSPSSPTVGAYQYSTATNPGWIPTKDFKVCGTPSEVTTATLTAITSSKLTTASLTTSTADQSVTTSVGLFGCVKNETCPVNAYCFENECACKLGYLIQNSECVSTEIIETSDASSDHFVDCFTFVLMCMMLIFS